MKKLLLASFILIFFAMSVTLIQLSCSKPVTAQNTTTNCVGPQPKFQFKVNNSLYVCDAIFDNRMGWIANHPISTPSSFGLEMLPSVYAGNPSTKKLYATFYKSNTDYAFLSFTFNHSSTLTTGIINTTNGNCEVYFPNNIGKLTKCNYTINFTRVSNGTADGTFSGTVWDPLTPSNTVAISAGEFSNIIIY